jgi:hypothetical protein
LVAALSIAQTAVSSLPFRTGVVGQMGAIENNGTRTTVASTTVLVSLAWLLVCSAILVSYARRPALLHFDGRRPRIDVRRTYIGSRS